MPRQSLGPTKFSQVKHPFFHVKPVYIKTETGFNETPARNIVWFCQLPPQRDELTVKLGVEAGGGRETGGQDGPDRTRKAGGQAPIPALGDKDHRIAPRRLETAMFARSGKAVRRAGPSPKSPHCGRRKADPLLGLPMRPTGVRIPLSRAHAVCRVETFRLRESLLAAGDSASRSRPPAAGKANDGR